MPRRPEPEPLAQKIGQRITMLRARKALSLPELAERSSIAKGHLSNTERGLSNPTALTLSQLAEGLNERPFVLLLSPEEDPFDELVDALRALTPPQRRQVRTLVKRLAKEKKPTRRRPAVRPGSSP